MNMNFLRKIPLPWLTVVAVWLGLAPFWPEPHLLEKLGMLKAGLLVRPLDIFDLLMHATPLVLLVWRLAGRLRAAKRPL